MDSMNTISNINKYALLSMHITRPLRAKDEAIPDGIRKLYGNISCQGACRACNTLFISYRESEDKTGWFFSQDSKVNNQEYYGEKIIEGEKFYGGASLLEALDSLKKELCAKYGLDASDEAWISI